MKKKTLTPVFIGFEMMSKAPNLHNIEFMIFTISSQSPKMEITQVTSFLDHVTDNVSIYWSSIRIYRSSKKASWKCMKL